jgi:predicted DNA-binding transcriptional regulator YafY
MYSNLLDEISRAIGARLLLQFTYNNSPYLVEPYLVGKNELNQDCLRAWQLKSPKEFLSDDAWDCFTLSEISDLKILDKQFTNKRPGYDPYDNTMKRIYYRI